ncbi:MAG: phosphatase PAP2 family protein, partial [Nitratireductor sp.]
ASPRILLMLFVVFSFAIVLFLDWLSPMAVEYASFKILFVTASMCLASALLFGWRGFRRTAIGLECLAAGFLLLIPVLISTYLAMSLNLPLADKELAAMDLALGIDWLAFMNWVNANPLIAKILDYSYNSFMPQLMLVPLILCLLKMPERGIAFVAGYALLCFISSVICIWYPALGTYTFYNIVPSDVPNINSEFGYLFLDQFNAVRSNPDFVLNVQKAAGIVTFPSVHAGTGCLLIWATWAIPYFRYPFFVVNALMCVGAVSQANHYVVDVVAGAGIAAPTAAIVSFVFLKRHKTPNSNIGNIIAQA